MKTYAIYRYSADSGWKFWFYGRARSEREMIAKIVWVNQGNIKRENISVLEVELKNDN